MLAWVKYAKKVIEPSSAREAEALRTSRTLQSLLALALKHGALECTAQRA